MSCRCGRSPPRPISMSSSPDPAWRIVSPAPRTAGLSLAGVHPRVRRMVLSQIRTVDSVAIYRGDEAIAVAMFCRHGCRRIEMALALHPDSHRWMRRLVRIAQLTLWGMAETRLIVANIKPGHGAGERMAMLVGFRRARLKQLGVWVFRRGEDEFAIWRRQQGSEEAGGTEPPAAGDRQRSAAGRNSR